MNNNSGNTKDTVFCIHCGFANGIGSKFCIRCGSKLEAVITDTANSAFTSEEPAVNNSAAFSSAELTENMSAAIGSSEPDADSAPVFAPSEDNSPVFDFADKDTSSSFFSADTKTDDAPAFSAIEETDTDTDSSAAHIISADNDVNVTSKVKPLETISAPAFSSADDTASAAGTTKDSASVPVTEEKKAKRVYEESDFAFATGLPEWNLEPPQVMVRRHRN